MEIDEPAKKKREEETIACGTSEANRKHVGDLENVRGFTHDEAAEERLRRPEEEWPEWPVPWKGIVLLLSSNGCMEERRRPVYPPDFYYRCKRASWMVLEHGISRQKTNFIVDEAILPSGSRPMVSQFGASIQTIVKELQLCAKGYGVTRIWTDDYDRSVRLITGEGLNGEWQTEEAISRAYRRSDCPPVLELHFPKLETPSPSTERLTHYAAMIRSRKTSSD